MNHNRHTAAFRRLHDEGILILANAWNAGTARLIESLGALAIATTSAGVAWSHSYRDGDALPVPKLLATVEAIIDAIHVPLSIDIEAGYSDDPEKVAGLAARLAELGVAGINLEDGSGTPQAMCRKLEAIRRACAALGTDLFVNARTDVWLRNLAPAEQRVQEALARARLYRESGADGLFVPGIQDRPSIEALAGNIGMPLNVLARAALPDAAELERWGVRRLSAGSDLAQSAYQRVSTLARGFLRDGLSSPLSADVTPYGDLNALFAETSG